MGCCFGKTATWEENEEKRRMLIRLQKLKEIDALEQQLKKEYNIDTFNKLFQLKCQVGLHTSLVEEDNMIRKMQIEALTKCRLDA